ncbi:flocculation protein FLO11-like [Cucumis melo var. makuwa]|uniref:Flocculation protein FLO11-like n=1 Tax=Cucumis melo var. makuwa TaxID=1194695 RepID=A0A5D3BN12_CUCMM|nr:flocculation protein FLO11-like [Cucumis melo var. makuwa]
MVATRFKSYQLTSTPSIRHFSMAIDSSSMASSPPKNASLAKGNITRLFCCVVYSRKFVILMQLMNQISTFPQPILFSVHSRFTQPSVSSSIPGSRVSIEMVILDLDSDSLNGDDSIVLSMLLRRYKIRDQSDHGKSPVPQASSLVTPSSPQSLEDLYKTDEDESGEDTDDDYVLVPEETYVPKETTVPDDDLASSPVNKTSEPQLTKVPRDSTTPLSPQGHVGSSSKEPRRPLVKRQRVISTKEEAHKWKFVVKHHIADESNISDQYQFCPAILEPILMQVRFALSLSVGEFYKVHIRGVCFTISPELLNQVLGITLSVDYSVSYPTLECLTEELTGGIVPI